MKKHWKIKTVLALLLVFITSFVMIGCDTVTTTTQDDIKGNLVVSFIDVGQADSILIQCDTQTMLIDAGNNDDGQLVEDYLKSRNITKIDYLVGTHPHEDHIGGLDYIIDNFEIEKVYMPKKTATTKTFKDVVNSLNKKAIKPIAPKVGESFKIGSANATILGPVKEYEDANDNSIVIKLDYQDTSFLFTGDAESISEKDIIKTGANLKADVLKLGHHGSRTSSSDKFLDEVNPRYAIISCEKDNDYGHPHVQTMDKMKERKIDVYRTDEEGTIVATSDGKNIKFDKEVGNYKDGKNSLDNNKSTEKKENINKEQNKLEKVYFTPNGKSYHLRKDCSGLKNSKTILSGTLNEAIDKGKDDPCDRCAI